MKNLNSWWQKLGTNLVTEKEVSTTPSPKNSYKRLIGRIIGFSTTCPHFVSNVNKHRDEVKSTLTGNKDPVSSSMPLERKSAKKTMFPLDRDVVGDEKVIFFLSPQQREILICKSSQRLIIHGGYGTGKSLLLKLKAIEMAKSGQRVYFAIGHEMPIRKSCSPVSTSPTFYNQLFHMKVLCTAFLHLHVVFVFFFWQMTVRKISCS